MLMFAGGESRSVPSLGGGVPRVGVVCLLAGEVPAKTGVAIVSREDSAIFLSSYHFISSLFGRPAHLRVDFIFHFCGSSCVVKLLLLAMATDAPLFCQREIYKNAGAWDESIDNLTCLLLRKSLSLAWR